MNNVPDLAGWTELSGGFTSQDRSFHCSTSGQVARPGEPIYRGQMIDQEGFYSICRDSALQLGKLVGLIDSDVSDAAVARQVELEDALAAANEKLRVQADYIAAEYALDDHIAAEYAEYALDDEIPDWVVNALQESPVPDEIHTGDFSARLGDPEE